MGIHENNIVIQPQASLWNNMLAVCGLKPPQTHRSKIIKSILIQKVGYVRPIIILLSSHSI